MDMDHNGYLVSLTGACMHAYLSVVFNYFVAVWCGVRVFHVVQLWQLQDRTGLDAIAREPCPPQLRPPLHRALRD